MNAVKVEVKPSEVHGLGCFATADIEEGEVIGLYEGQLMMLDPDEDWPSRHFMYLDDSDWTECSRCKRDQFHIGILGTGLLKYINSTQDQETEANVDMQRCFVVAAKPLSTGEELLMDYEFEDE